MANHIFSCSRAAPTRSTTVSADAPPSAAAAAARTIIPMPPQAVRLSITWIRSPPRPSSISRWRDCSADS